MKSSDITNINKLYNEAADWQDEMEPLPDAPASMHQVAPKGKMNKQIIINALNNHERVPTSLFVRNVILSGIPEGRKDLHEYDVSVMDIGQAAIDVYTGDGVFQMSDDDEYIFFKHGAEPMDFMMQ